MEEVEGKNDLGLDYGGIMIDGLYVPPVGLFGIRRSSGLYPWSKEPPWLREFRATQEAELERLSAELENLCEVWVIYYTERGTPHPRWVAKTFKDLPLDIQIDYNSPELSLVKGAFNSSEYLEHVAVGTTKLVAITHLVNGIKESRTHE